MAKKKVGTVASADVIKERQAAGKLWSAILSVIRQKDLMSPVVSLNIKAPFVSKPLAAWTWLILITSRGFLRNSRFRVQLICSSGDPQDDLFFNVYSRGDLKIIPLDEKGEIIKEKRDSRLVPHEDEISDKLIEAKYKVALFKNLLPLFQGVVSPFLAPVSRGEEEEETALRVEVKLGPGRVIIPREVNGASKASLMEILGKLPPCPGEAVNFVRVIELKKRRPVAATPPPEEAKKE